MASINKLAWTYLGVGPARVTNSGSAGAFVVAQSKAPEYLVASGAVVAAGAFMDFATTSALWALGMASTTVTAGLIPPPASQVTKASILLLDAYLVAGLPAAASNPGATCYVTDATSSTNGATATGGGSTPTLVRSNGVNWIIIG
jgi:hypothetical protein